MTTPVLRPRPERFGNLRLGIVAVALAVALVLLPRPLARVMSGRGYGDDHDLTGAVVAAFVHYWRSGRRALTPELSHLVDYWRWFHVVKAMTAIGLLVILVVLATRLWRAYARTDPSSSAWPPATGGVMVTVLSLGAFALALANVQVTFAPFSSLMSMLPISSAHGELEAMVGQVKHELGHYPSGSSGTLRMMVGDFAWYHVVVAVICWSVAVLLIVVPIASWRRRPRSARTDRRTRRSLTSLGLASALLTTLVVVLALANTSAALDSPTAVLNFYDGTY